MLYVKLNKIIFSETIYCNSPEITESKYAWLTTQQSLQQLYTVLCNVNTNTCLKSFDLSMYLTYMT